MAEEENEETTEADGNSGSDKKKKLLLIAGGVLLLCIAIGAPVAIMLMKGGAETDDAHLSGDAAHTENDLQLEGIADEDELEEDEEALGAIFPLETFVVNLAEKGYLRCQMQLEFETRDVPKRFYVRLVPIRDQIITLLNSKKRSDLLSAKGVDQLKEEVKEVANEVLRRADVRNVYFTQFVVQ